MAWGCLGRPGIGLRGGGGENSVHEFTLEDQLIILCGAVNARTRGKDLDEAPAVAGVLMDCLLISVACFGPCCSPTFAESDELVFVFGVSSRHNDVMLDRISVGGDYN